MRGIPVWATLIALVHADDGVVVVGVVSAPALGRRWWASRGGGTFADGRRCRVSDVDTIAAAQVSVTLNAGWDDLGLTPALVGLARDARRARGFGDFWQHALVAEGALDVAVDAVGVAPYDIAAVRLLVEEAGGTFTDRHGVATHEHDTAISTNGHLHAEVLRRLTTPCLRWSLRELFAHATTTVTSSANSSRIRHNSGAAGAADHAAHDVDPQAGRRDVLVDGVDDPGDLPLDPAAAAAAGRRQPGAGERSSAGRRAASAARRRRPTATTPAVPAPATTAPAAAWTLRSWRRSASTRTTHVPVPVSRAVAATRRRSPSRPSPVAPRIVRIAAPTTPVRLLHSPRSSRRRSRRRWCPSTSQASMRAMTS